MSRKAADTPVHALSNCIVRSRVYSCLIPYTHNENERATDNGKKVYQPDVQTLLCNFGHDHPRP